MECVQVLVFIAASLLVIITPGQDLLLVMSRAVSQGSKAGIITASGVSVGLLGHSVLAALGVGAILLASASLFMVLKTVGALYLMYLGIKMIVKSGRGIELAHAKTISSRQLFITGAFSNLSNPQVTLFYFAFLPQFIPGDVAHQAIYLLGLGICFALLTFVVKGPVGYFAGALSGWLRTHPAVLRWIDRTSGMLLIALGLRLALTRR